MVWILDVLGWWIVPMGLIGSWAMWAAAGLGQFDSEEARQEWQRGTILAGAITLVFLVAALVQASQ